jgi:ABC-type transport system substrate-binding protein
VNIEFETVEWQVLLNAPRATPDDAALKTLAEATDEATMQSPYRKAHERLVDNPPWLYIVHDLNPRPMSKKVKGFVSAQSWFLDLTLVSLD